MYRLPQPVRVTELESYSSAWVLDFAGKQTILHAVDVRGQLYIDNEKKSETYGERIFEITKNRFGCSGKSYVLGIQKTGLYEKGSFGG